MDSAKFQHVKPTSCADCGEPIRGAYCTRKKAHATRCHRCSRAATQRAKWPYAGNRRDAGRDYHLRTKYGITLAEYRERAAEQGGVCAVCGDPPVGRRAGEEEPLLHVDHDHVTGGVRELICTRCNQALGCALDDPDRLRALADYLERHRVLMVDTRTR